MTRPAPTSAGLGLHGGYFARIARTFARDWGVQVRVGSCARALLTRGVVELPGAVEFLEGEGRAALEGLLDHEAAGHLLQEKEWPEGQRPSDVLMRVLERPDAARVKRLLNVAEDVRVERAAAARWPGIAANLLAAHRFMAGRLRRTHETDPLPAVEQALLLVLARARGYADHYAWLPPEAHALVDRLGPEVERVRSAVTPEDAYEAALALQAGLERLAAPPPPPPPSPAAAPAGSGEDEDETPQTPEDPESAGASEGGDDEDEGDGGDDEDEDEDGVGEGELGPEGEDGLGGEGEALPPPELDEADDSEPGEDDGEGGEGGEGAEGDGCGSEDEGEDEGEDGEDDGGRGSDEDGDERAEGDGCGSEGDDEGPGDAEGAEGQESGEDEGGDEQDGAAGEGTDDRSGEGAGEGGAAGAGSGPPDEDPDPADKGEVAGEALAVLTGLEDLDPTASFRDGALNELVREAEAAAREAPWRDLPHPAAAARDRFANTCPSARSQATYSAAWAAAQKVIGGLSARLAALLRTTREQRLADRRTGRVDPTALHRVRAGRTDVFEQDLRLPGLDTAVAILLDESGSMSGGRAGAARELVLALGEALHRAAVPFEVLGWLEEPARGAGSEGGLYTRIEARVVHEFKTYGESWPRVRGRLGHSGGYGNNDDAGATLYVARRLAARPERRKVLFVVSDGAPCHAGRSTPEAREDLKGALGLVERAGIETAGIGIASPHGQDLYGRWETVASLADLPGAAVRLLQKLLVPCRRAA